MSSTFPAPNFSRASPRAPLLHGSARPPLTSDPTTSLPSWATFMRSHGITRSLCLLTDAEAADYRAVGGYQRGVEDAGMTEAVMCNMFEDGAWDRVVAAMERMEESGEGMVVHCVGGEHRTGNVLAAWLVRRYGLGVDEAVAEVVREAEAGAAVRKPGVAEVRKLLEEGRLG